VLKWSINPISNPKPLSRVTHTRDSMYVFYVYYYYYYYSNDIVWLPLNLVCVLFFLYSCSFCNLAFGPLSLHLNEEWNSNVYIIHTDTHIHALTLGTITNYAVQIIVIKRNNFASTYVDVPAYNISSTCASSRRLTVSRTADIDQRKF
jgi:hypothetical protein